MTENEQGPFCSEKMKKKYGDGPNYTGFVSKRKK